MSNLLEHGNPDASMNLHSMDGYLSGVYGWSYKGLGQKG
jgi:hypothetical protein